MTEVIKVKTEKAEKPNTFLADFISDAERANNAKHEQVTCYTNRAVELSSEIKRILKENETFKKTVEGLTQSLVEKDQFSAKTEADLKEQIAKLLAPPVTETQVEAPVEVPPETPAVPTSETAPDQETAVA